jgi:hypothetical protein
LFLIDILVNFNTGYRDHDVVVVDHRLIAYHYLFGWFFIDLLATVPFYLFFENPYSETHRAFRLPQTLRLLRLLRLFRARRVMLNFRESLRLGHVFERLSKLVVSAALVAHWFACAFYFIGSIEKSKGLDNWIDREQLSGASVPVTYITCVYWAMATMTTVGKFV